mmetsp:Transcript_30005/g.77169  ORF Transcript_30005/g.77169 Transcript_30005/m.77169 type:complete len:80 (-) Transcript_30005:189-428(-)
MSSLLLCRRMVGACPGRREKASLQRVSALCARGFVEDSLLVARPFLRCCLWSCGELLQFAHGAGLVNETCFFLHYLQRF